MNNFPNDDFVVMWYKFKDEDKIIIKMVTKDAYEELKNAPQIEYCKLMK